MYVHVCIDGLFQYFRLYSCPSVSIVNKSGRSWEHLLYVLKVVLCELGVYLRLSLWGRRDKTVKLLVLEREPCLLFVASPLLWGTYLRSQTFEKREASASWKVEARCSLTAVLDLLHSTGELSLVANNFVHIFARCWCLQSQSKMQRWGHLCKKSVYIPEDRQTGPLKSTGP